MTNSELKSKVMTLGNKLAPRMGGDRKAAFVRAWAIVKAGGLELAVRGVSFGNRQEALRRLAGYAPEQVRAFLVPEPENQADPAAVAVMVGVNGGKGLYRLGHAPRTLAPVAAARGGRLPRFRLVDGDIRGGARLGACCTCRFLWLFSLKKP
jgi:hypothetical protein